ncbi:MAG: hypothetical protein HC869_17110 [Rhodospirillales bacterium]|nr:hypothetical protein [Rhodospirillales bacterium]
MNFNLITSNRVFSADMSMLVESITHDARLRTIETLNTEGGFRVRASSDEYAIVIKAISIAEDASEALEREYKRHDRTVARIDQVERHAMSDLKRSAARRGGRPNANMRARRQIGGRKLRIAA